MIQKSVLTRLEYRVSFFISLVTMTLYYVVQYSIVAFTVISFDEINGWNLPEISFLYSFVLLAQGINTAIFGPLVRFDELIRKGEWDFLLIKPLRPLAALLSMKFDITAIVHLVLGIFFFSHAVRGLEIEFGATEFLWSMACWFGGALILAAIRLAVASIAFIAVSTESLVHFFVYSSKEFILYPINIYKSPVPFILTFLFPIAFINYYPAHLFVDKTGLFFEGMKYLTLPVGLTLYIISLGLFKAGNRRYHSTGT